MTDTASLIRITLADDNAGGRTRSESTLGPYAFRLHSEEAFTGRGQGREDGSADRVRGEGYWVGFFPAGTVVLPADIVLHGARRYEVIQETGDRTEHAVVAVALRRAD